MTALHSVFVKKRHAYTGADVPWRIDTDRTIAGMSATSEVHRSKWRLFHYLSGGGSAAFGASDRLALKTLRQARFLKIAAVLGVLWLVFRFV